MGLLVICTVFEHGTFRRAPNEIKANSGNEEG